MWTPKRIILLAGGFLLFTCIYLVYSLTSLGRINTLPPLPEQYRPINGRSAGIIPSRLYKQTPLELKLEQAFGTRCPELTWPVQLDLNPKSLVMAAVKCEPTEHGRLRLAPMSLALFGKKKDDGRDVEINTLKCREAYIRFDRPVSGFTPSELNGRKLVEAQLFGDTNTSIRITNNRRTKKKKDDDLIVTITNGPLYYIEQLHLIRTSDHIRILDGEMHTVDGQLVPPKADIRARGMEMELTTSSPPPRPGVFPSAKPKNESISGVKRIILKEAVDMHLYVAGGEPFPGSKKTSAKEPVAGRPAKPALIHITTPGRFQYDLFKDHDMARFDVPADAQQFRSPQDVIVERINKETGYDMLVCKHLELRLKRRNEASLARKDERRDARPRKRGDAGLGEQGIEIETAHATGPYVTLTSDAEKLDAHGTDFFHDVGQKLTILKGKPLMRANKEESVIEAPELRIQEVPVSADASSAGNKGTKAPALTYQQVEAVGSGSIHMMNKTTGKPTIHAKWKKKLVSTRENGMDLLILLGSASFDDEESKQSLKAEELNVWLLAEEKKPVAKAKIAAPAQALASPGKGAKGEGAKTKKPATPVQSRRPHRVKALRNVHAHSADLNIHDAARLEVHFVDVPLERMPPPSSSNSKPAAPPLNRKAAVPLPAVSAPSPLPAPAPTGLSKTDAPKTKTDAPKTKTVTPIPMIVAGGKPPVDAPQQVPENRPIDLSATSIEATVLRCGERMALDHLWAQGGALDNVDKRGGVIVRQQGRQVPGKPREEGVYLEGNTLDMSCTPDGNLLQVTGDLARLKMDTIFILGPEVNIDQVANKAWVVGEGAMQIQSNTTLEGKALKRAVPLTIHWSDSMLFCGVSAVFEGSIQAEQESSRLACQVLQVLFDHPISLKEGMRGDRPAKVRKLVADKGTSSQDVRAETQNFDEYGELDKYELLMGKDMQMETIQRGDEEPRQAGKSKDANKVVLSGPGSVRILQRGDADLTLTPDKPQPDRSAAAAPAALPSGERKTKETQKQEMKLTYIEFEQQMQANNLKNVASFWGAVRVLNLPCTDPQKDSHRDIDLDDMLVKELPPRAMYLRCNVLKVGTYKRSIRDSNNKVQTRIYQAMDAQGQVYVQGREYTAQCDHMTFNEEKDQVIFIGEGDNFAVLSRSVVKGADSKIFRGKKIIYYRSTGRVDVPQLGSFDG